MGVSALPDSTVEYCFQPFSIQYTTKKRNKQDQVSKVGENRGQVELL